MNEEEYLTRYEDNVTTLNAIVNKVKKLDLYTKLFKAGIYLGFISGIIIPIFLILFIGKCNADKVESSSLIISIISSLSIAFISIGCLLYNNYRIKNYTQQFELTNQNIYDVTVTYLITSLNISEEKFNFTLNDILDKHTELIDNWWCNTDRVNVIKDELYKILHIDQNNLEKSDLLVENIKLKNESISIDNDQKKFWTCPYCGNMNRGDDMSCIKCGANRT